MERRVAGALAVRREGHVHEKTWSEVSWPPQSLFWLKSAPSLPSMKTLLIETGRSPVFCTCSCCWPPPGNSPWSRGSRAGWGDRQLLPHPLAVQRCARLTAIAGVGDVEFGAAISAGRRREADAHLAALAGAEGDPVQLSTVTAKSDGSVPPIETPLTSIGSGPSLVKKTCWSGLETPTNVLGNSSEAGPSSAVEAWATEGTAASPSRTARRSRLGCHAACEDGIGHRPYIGRAGPGLNPLRSLLNKRGLAEPELGVLVGVRRGLDLEALRDPVVHAAVNRDRVVAGVHRSLAARRQLAGAGDHEKSRAVLQPMGSIGGTPSSRK